MGEKTMDKSQFIGRDFLKIADYTPDEIVYMLDVSADFKARLKRREPHALFPGYSAAALFEKQSTRTRTSFQAACAHLGIMSFYMRPEEMQLGRGEPIKDTARVIDRYCDLLFIRTFGQEIVDEFAHYMENPVINALTDQYHPCQALADLLTIREHKGAFRGLKVAYAGDVWNVCQSLMTACAMTGMDYYLAHPEEYVPYPEALDNAHRFAADSGSRIVLTQNLDEAVEGADVVVANTWHSMGGPEKTKEQRIIDFQPFQITPKAMERAKADAIFMHCLPAYRGEEMTEEVIDGAQSVVFDEAENRLHTEKAVVYLVLDLP
jgi:ornithine carbamoyltransferase